ncbi:MAG: hypothetical protein LBF62_11915, partial [Tannerellaceae bacterium]|nr:hypothetical protein [Tannerellaceae bacterium]
CSVELSVREIGNVSKGSLTEQEEPYERLRVRFPLPAPSASPPPPSGRRAGFPLQSLARAIAGCAQASPVSPHSPPGG